MHNPESKNPADPFLEPLSLLSSEFRKVTSQIQELELAHVQRIETAAAEFRTRLREQLEAEMRRKLEQEFQTAVEVIREEFQQRLHSATAEWESERESLRNELEDVCRQVNGQEEMAMEVQQAEATLESLQHEIQAMLDDSAVELSRVMQKRSQKLELEGYIKGLKFKALVADALKVSPTG